MRGFWIVTAAAAMALVPTSAAEANEPITGGVLPPVSECVPVDPALLPVAWLCVAVDDDTTHYPSATVCVGHFGNGPWAPPCVRTFDSPYSGTPGACVGLANLPDAVCFLVHRDRNGDGVMDDCHVWVVGGTSLCHQN